MGEAVKSRTLNCFDCNRKYGDEYGFPDLVVPNDVWERISPKGNEGGLLCPSCICKRLHGVGIRTIGRFRSGPLCESDEPKTEPKNEQLEYLLKLLPKKGEIWKSVTGGLVRVDSVEFKNGTYLVGSCNMYGNRDTVNLVQWCKCFVFAFPAES